MTFVTAGLAIAGMIAVGIPILIHLLSRQRRRPIEWAAMRFLIEAFKKHRRRLQIEQLLLLLVRCLIVALIGIALARPILESAGLLNVGGSRAVFLIIDNGLASGVTDLETQQSALRQHVEQANQLIESLDVGDAVGVVTTARPARGLLTPPSNDHGSVARLVADLEPNLAPSDLSGALSILKDAVVDLDDRYDQVLVYLFSEFRAGSAHLNSPLPADLGEIQRGLTLLASPPSEIPASNVQVVAIEPVRSLVLPGVVDGSGQVVVKLERHGGSLDRDVTRVRLAGDGVATLAPKTVTWQPGQSEAQVEFLLAFAVTGDREIGLVASIDNDSVAGDNNRFGVIELRDEIRVLLIDRRSFGFEPSVDRLPAGQWIRRALEPWDGSPIEIVAVEPTTLDVVDLRTADAAVLPRPDLLPDASWTLLREFVDRGGLLVVTPPAELNVHPWVEHFEDELSLPWRVALETRTHETALALATEQPDTEILRMISAEIDELVVPIFAIKTLPVDLEQSQVEAVLRFEDGSPLVVVGTPESVVADGDLSGEPPSPIPARGLVVYLTVAPELAWSTLPANPLMVPLFQELVRQGLSLTRSERQLLVGDQPALALSAAVRDLIDPEGELLPLDARGRPRQPFSAAGLYALTDQASQNVGSVAVNVDAAAGRTETQSRAAVSSWLSAAGEWELFDSDDLTAALQRTKSGATLAGTLLWIVLALVLLETALARWFSHAHALPSHEGSTGGLRATIDESQTRAATS